MEKPTRIALICLGFGLIALLQVWAWGFVDMDLLLAKPSQEAAVRDNAFAVAVVAAVIRVFVTGPAVLYLWVKLTSFLWRKGQALAHTTQKGEV